jgi:CheY-like chemotaxis protein
LNWTGGRRTFRTLRTETGSEDTTRVRIVIADDSAALRSVVRITVETEGWTVVEAATGDAALALIREEPPDLVLLDLDFGASGPDGLEVLRRVREDRATALVPVVVLTANERPDVREQAIAGGANEYLTKPFGPLDLIATMRGVLGRHLEAARLGLHLVQSGALAPEHLHAALELQRERRRAGTPIALGALLVECAMISRPALEEALRSQKADAAR